MSVFFRGIRYEFVIDSDVTCRLKRSRVGSDLANAAAAPALGIQAAVAAS